MTIAIRTLLTLVVLAGCADASAAPPIAPIDSELAARREVADSVKAAIGRDDIDAFETLSTRYRSTDRETASGVSKLLLFHANAAYYLSPAIKPGQCEMARAALDRWDAKYPSSPAAPVVRAAILLRQAWCYRGDGPARSVPEASWSRFHASVEAAHNVLARRARTAANDPEYDAVMVRVYQLQGRDKAAVQQLLASAAKRHPGYYNTYFEAYEYFRPQWFGSVAEIDELARLAAEHNRARDGLGGYARVYWHVSNCNCRANMAAMDWSMMTRAMADVMARYPSEWNAANFSRIACAHGDLATAARYAAMVRGDDADAWNDKQERAICKAAVARTAGQAGG